MRCGRCRYYFCWLCGGDGVKSSAYLCKKTGVSTFWKDDGPYHQFSSKTTISHQVKSIQQYSKAKLGLENCMKRFAAFNQDNHKIAQEIQLSKTLVWLRAYSLNQCLGRCIKKRAKEILDTANSIEITLGITSQSINVSEVRSIVQGGESIIAPVQRNCNAKKKIISKTQRKEMDRQLAHDEMIAPNIREFILLTQLQNMNDEQMNTHISQVLKNQWIFFKRLSVLERRQRICLRLEL